MHRREFMATAAACVASPAFAQVSARTCYPLQFDRLEGGALALGDFAGKPILVVNTASFCGYTPQFEGLQALWSQMGPRGLHMIGVPSNDFGGQEPGGPQEIRQTASQFHVSFPLAAKVRVTGAEAHPFYKWAALEKPRELPRWNFHKYLIGHDGHVAASFSTDVTPGDSRILVAIDRELRAGAG